MINSHLVRAGNYEDMWVLPIYLKPGKNDNFIRGAEDPHIIKKISTMGRDKVRLHPYQNRDNAEFFFFYERHFVEINQEPVPVCKSNTCLLLTSNQFPVDVKTLKVRDEQLTFSKP